MREQEAVDGIRRQLQRLIANGALSVGLEVPPELDFAAALTHAELYAKSLGFIVSERWRYFDFTNGRSVGFRLTPEVLW